MSEPFLPDPECEDLIVRRFDERLSEAEFAAFDERLRSDPAFRRHYVRHADLNACLYDEFSEVPDRIGPVETKQEVSWMRRAIVWTCLVGAVAALMMTVWSSFRRTDDVASGGVASAGVSADLTKELSQNVHPNDLPDSRIEDRRIGFVAEKSLSAQDVAVLVIVEGQSSGEFTPGFRFRPGTLRLSGGYMQIEFVSGAVIGLTGPAELQIESSSSATIFSGHAAAYVPDRARGFVLNTPSAAVVDLGTEFAVGIDQSGNTELEVTSGEVELSLLGDDGSTLLSERVDDTRAVRVDRQSLRMSELGNNSTSLPQLRSVPEKPLSVSSRYVQSVLDCRPLIYWRFEESQQQAVRNEAGEKWMARIHAAETEPEGLQFVNGSARFRRTSRSRFLHISESLPDFNSGDYSIELWIRPDDLSHSTCLGIFPENEPDARTHLNVIEIATETFLIHEPGAIRFLHRYPPERKWQLGTNAFSKGVCTPYQWQHIVCVKQADSMSLYYNGRMARRVALSNASGPGPYRLLAGQLNPTSTWRQYSGAMDEVAVYNVSLTDEQVADHYRLMMEQ